MVKANVGRCEYIDIDEMESVFLALHLGLVLTRESMSIGTCCRSWLRGGERFRFREKME